MSKISVIPMSHEMCRQYYRGFERDADTFMEMNQYRPFVYSDEWADAYFKKQLEKKRLLFAIVEGNIPVGEILLKDINSEKGECTLSIHLQNDTVKGKGIGTRAEQLILEYAFAQLHMKVIFADAVLKNKRSQHVLEKVGFQAIRQDEMFKYYEMRSENRMNF